MSGLLPCPFCGAAPVWCGDVPMGEAHACAQIRCDGCGMQLDNHNLIAASENVTDARAAMASAWNRRHSQISYAPETNPDRPGQCKTARGRA